MSTRERILHRLTRSDVVRRMYCACRSVPFLGSGLRSLVHAALPVGTRLWIQIPDGFGKGFWMYADPRTERGYTNGDHEPWLQHLLRSELRPGSCYYDIGAHSGFFCLMASRTVGSSGAVLAIEADPENAGVLRNNLARNGLNHIAVIEAAVWSSSGRVGFSPDSAQSNRTQGRVIQGNTDNMQLSVPAVCLDDLVFVEGRRAPDLVKIDVEGAEMEALLGARRLLTEIRPKLLCEIHDPAQMAQIREYITQWNYSAEEWNPAHPRYADYRQLYLWAVAKPLA